MSRIELEKQARVLGLTVDGKMSDNDLKKAIEEKGTETMAAAEGQGTRFHEPQGEERFIPVDDEQPEFKKDAGQDKIKQKVKASEKLFPVKLVKNYRPISPDFQIQGEGGVYRPPNEEERAKVPAGEFIALPVAEAQSVIEKKIAERNDPIR
ncbi:hypothetical protein G9X67_34625 [Rhizobium sp. WYCCWR 11152]|uniref:hypothetical protein n=1 Tax=Rhizobium sp. WYCCWR 11152 TaxID=2692316 RepID=UPI001492B29C|nr:hypothetical protein [Rhizobium sp. WYCCWR 11152]NNU70388.1 hypothetical protein [Rhizobium sp. WYCCWR 11152]